MKIILQAVLFPLEVCQLDRWDLQKHVPIENLFVLVFVLVVAANSHLTSLSCGYFSHQLLANVER